MVELRPEVEALWRRLERAVDRRESDRSVLSGLERLARVAPDDSEASRFAARRLAERIATRDPWRASLLAKRVLSVDADDDGAWGILALAQSLMGHHRYAIRAYRKALALAPYNPFYAHNLGHLYDVVLDRPDLAVPWLQRALEHLAALRAGDDDTAARAEASWDEALASYAQALLRRGRTLDAQQVMREVVQGRATPAQHALYSEILAAHDQELDEAMAATPEPPRRPVRKRRHTRAGG